MGVWGCDIFECDIACDVRDSFLKHLKKENFNCELATKRLLDEYLDNLESDEVASFWFALADTQWSRGILLDDVKDTAINYTYSISDDEILVNYPDNFKKRKQIVEKLRKKIQSTQPAVRLDQKEKKKFVCGWKNGDVFYYRLTSEYAELKNVSNRHLIFYKVDEQIDYEGNVYPIVYVKITKDDKVPKNIEELDDLDFVQISVVAEWYRGVGDDIKPFLELQKYIAEHSKTNYERDDHGFIPNYRIALCFTSKRNVPKEMLYLGNFNLTPPQRYIYKEKVQEILWKNAEKIIIDRYHAFNLRKSPLYSGIE